MEMKCNIINLDEHRTIDPHRDYYDLPLEQRFSEYQRWGWRRPYEHRQKVLKQLYENDKGEERLTPEQLTVELRGIIPSFEGVVLRRDYNGWPSYVLTQEDMQALFGEPVFGRVTGKVVVASDSLISPDHQDLAGHIILIGEQESLEKEGFIASHEGYHASHTGYPNALRRDKYHRQLRDTTGLSPEEIVHVMIGLDRAIQIGEAGAVIDSYGWLECRTWKPWIPGGNGARYDANLIKEWYGRFGLDFVTELKNASRNMLGFQLSSARSSGQLSDDLIDAINQHERDSLVFPVTVKEATERMSRRLQNPEGLEPLGYAMSYAKEALQIVDYPEIIDGKLEPFCVDVLEPQRLGSWPGFGAAFAQALTRHSAYSDKQR